MINTNTSPYGHLKPVPQFFEGIRYRSTNEARFALFCAMIDEPFEYEPQAFDLDGRWYLPDFFLPKWEMFVELTPPTEAIDKDHLDRMSLLARVAGKGVACFRGLTYEGGLEIVMPSGKIVSYRFRGDCSECGALYIWHLPKSNTRIGNAHGSLLSAQNKNAMRELWMTPLTVKMRSDENSITRSRIPLDRAGKVTCKRFKCVVCRRYGQLATTVVEALSLANKARFKDGKAIW